MIDEREKVYSLEQLSQKDPELLDRILKQIVESSEENSLIRKRYKAIDNLIHELRNKISSPKAFMHLLERVGELPEGCATYTEEKRTFSDTEFKIFGREDPFDRVLGVIKILSNNSAMEKIAVGVGLEGIFSQLVGEEEDVPKQIKPGDIIKLSTSQIVGILEENKEKLKSFFNSNLTEDEETKDFRMGVLEGIGRVIETAKDGCEDFLKLNEQNSGNDWLTGRAEI